MMFHYDVLEDPTRTEHIFVNLSGIKGFDDEKLLKPPTPVVLSADYSQTISLLQFFLVCSSMLVIATVALCLAIVCFSSLLLLSREGCAS